MAITKAVPNQLTPFNATLM